MPASAAAGCASASNEMGGTPLRIGAAHIGLRASGAAPGGRHRPRPDCSAGGPGALTIPAGAARLVSDRSLQRAAFRRPRRQPLPAGSTRVTTLHNAALQTSYVSTAGNRSAAPALPVSRSHRTWPSSPRSTSAAPTGPGGDGTPWSRSATRSPTARPAAPTPTGAGRTCWRGACSWSWAWPAEYRRGQPRHQRQLAADGLSGRDAGRPRGRWNASTATCSPRPGCAG
jgi:hypothetical protein